MAAASGGNGSTYAARLKSIDYSVVEVKTSFKTRWFQLVSLNKNLPKVVKAIDEKLSGFASVRNCGLQTFEKDLNGKMYRCYAYSVTSDTKHQDFVEDERKIDILKSGEATLKEIDADKIDASGEPNLKPVFGLEFQLFGGVVNQNFDVIIESIKSRFEDFAKFSNTTNSAVSFVDKKTAHLRIQCDSISKRPAGSYDISVAESGRYFSVLARCFGVAPDANVGVERDSKKRCHKCRSEDHLVADCPLRRKNQKKVTSTTAPTNTNTTNENVNLSQPRPKRRCTQTAPYQAGTGGMENLMVDDRQNNDPEHLRGERTEVQAFDENENLILPNGKLPQQSSIIRSEPVVPTTEVLPTPQNISPEYANAEHYFQNLNEALVQQIPNLSLDQIQHYLNNWPVAPTRWPAALSPFTRGLLLQRQQQLGQQLLVQNPCPTAPQAYNSGQPHVVMTNNNNQQTGLAPPGAYHGHQNTNQVDNQLMTTQTATNSTNPNELPDSVTQTMIMHTDGIMPLTTGN